MNTIINCHTTYIKPNLTLETILFKNSDKIFYIYNYQGKHFRLFTNLIDLISFFQSGEEPKHSFLSEIDLDIFIENHI